MYGGGRRPEGEASQDRDRPDGLGGPAPTHSLRSL